MTLIKFNEPKRDKSLMPGFNDVFDSIFNDTFFSDRAISRVPAVNVSETADNYHIELAAPGLSKQDFKIKVDDRVLTVSAEREQHHTEGKKYSKMEYSYSSFVRSFNLPEVAEDERIEASYMDGILRIDIPKKEEAKSVTRQIEIK